MWTICGIVQMFGDTTLQSSHIQALKSLGVKARFRTDGGKQDLINRIQAGFPVPIGILHHGHVSSTIRRWRTLHRGDWVLRG